MHRTQLWYFISKYIFISAAVMDNKKWAVSCLKVPCSMCWQWKLRNVHLCNWLCATDRFCIDSSWSLECFHEQGRLRSACADAQADLSLLCLHMLQSSFSHGMAQMLIDIYRHRFTLCDFSCQFYEFTECCELLSFYIVIFPPPHPVQFAHPYIKYLILMHFHSYDKFSVIQW